MIKNKHQVLKETFGFDEFRPLQQEVIDKIINHEDVLLILPTGGGKSLCYQLPSLLMDGVVVVVSPLLALMQDQVYGLQAKGVVALMMSSMQNSQQIAQAEQDLQNETARIIFVSPERLQNNNFLQFLTTINIAFFAIDEAHCVSEWGHEFRADYRQLGLLKNNFPDIGIAAFTATATKQVEQDIINQLQFKQQNNIIRGKIYRDNLLINVQARQKNGQQQLLDFLQNHLGEQGIIYTLSRKNTESLSEFLNNNGFKANAYHAGLSSQERSDIYQDFVNDRSDIVVATIAFGMGIDKSNIRFVVHMSLPKTMEAYYQEMGRAGRDGLDSEVLLLYSFADLVQLGRFIDDIDNQTYKNLAYQKLNLMKQYAFSEGCRHQMLSKYFDDTMPKCQIKCDNCLTPDTKRSDITDSAQMFLSAVYRVQQNFGKTYVIDILLGLKTQKILNNKHHKLSVYGVGNNISRTLWNIINDRLLETEALTLGEFNVLKLTDIGIKILKSQQKIDICSSHLQASAKVIKPKKPAKYEVDDEIFTELRQLRMQIAKAEAMPPYIIFDNKTLTEMAYFLPDNEEKLRQINGVGEVKLAKYGKQFLELLNKLKTDNPKKSITSTTKSLQKLPSTYQQTLDLIEQNLSIKEICKQRNLGLLTILKHINKLTNEQQISPAKRQQLFTTVPLNQDINDWINQGLQYLNSIDDMHQYLYIYQQLMLNKNNHQSS